MTDKLLTLYNSERSYIQRLANEFVENHADAAARLRIRKDGTDDPHVARLLDGFAYLTARIRRKLDDEYPESTEARLNALYPHYLAPIPSAGVVQFVLDRSQGELTTGYDVQRGAEVSLVDANGLTCTYRTCYATTLWPLEIAACALQRRPFSAPAAPGSTDAMSVLHLKLECASAGMSFDQFDLDHLRSLRFFLQGQDHHVLALYELLMNNTRQIALAVSPADEHAVYLDPGALQPVGFDLDQAMLPYGPRSFPGYRLLTEYFAYPFKYYFVDLGGIDVRRLEHCDRALHIYFYLDRSAAELESVVGPEALRMGCTPIVNLFAKRAEPIKLTQTVSRYHVIPDARRQTEMEVYAVNRVSSAEDNGEMLEYHPLYAIQDVADPSPRRTFWTSSRESTEAEQQSADAGSEVFLTIVDRDADPYRKLHRTLVVETTCLNRDLPGSLKRPRAELVEGGPFRAIELLKGPTDTVRAMEAARRQWALISHLSLSHLSISHRGPGGDEDPLSVAAIRHILELYDFGDRDSVKRKIQGILSVRHQRAVGRTHDSGSAFCRGVDITIEFDEDQFPDHGLFLFASLLERFLGLYCSINSFSRMTARIKQRDGVLRQWPPRTGDQILL